MKIRTDRSPDVMSVGQKRIFVVASRPVTEGKTTIRHIVIFDNHPASLQVLFSGDFVPRRRNAVLYALVAIALVLAAGLGILWPLF